MISGTKKTIAKVTSTKAVLLLKRVPWESRGATIMIEQTRARDPLLVLEVKAWGVFATSAECRLSTLVQPSGCISSFRFFS